jgi:hypothetical protein
MKKPVPMKRRLESALVFGNAERGIPVEQKVQQHEGLRRLSHARDGWASVLSAHDCNHVKQISKEPPWKFFHHPHLGHQLLPGVLGSEQQLRARYPMQHFNNLRI